VTELQQNQRTGNVLICGGHLVDPAAGIDALRDVVIRDGHVVEILEHADPAKFSDCYVIDAKGAYVAPGFIDMHVHLREPGFTHKETIATGSAAAVAGGFTAVAAMPNTEPALDTPGLIKDVLRLAAAAGLARVYPIAAITKARAGKELVPYWQLSDAGAVAFSDDGSTVADPRVLRQAALYARDVPGPFISHCEDERLKGDAVMNESANSARMGLCGAPGLAEEIIVARDLLIAGDVGRAWHIAHLSTARSMALMRFARAEGIQATCEVTPHHLLLDDSAFSAFNADAKVNPPLRGASDARLLRDAVRAGEVEVFATDHAPHTREEKALLLDAAPVGFTGLEVAIGAYAAAITDLPVSRFVAMLSTNPARILGVAGGTLSVGSVADVTIFADQAWTVDPTLFQSKGKNTPLSGRSLPRRALATIVSGRIVMQAGHITPILLAASTGA
jgi:dihydroorotase